MDQKISECVKIIGEPLFQYTSSQNKINLQTQAFYYIQHYHRLEQANPGLKIRSLMVGANENEENTENNVFLEETSILYPLKQYLEGMDSFFFV